MFSVRTTLSLEPDVAHRLKQMTASGKKSFKEVVNESLRLGLGLKKAQRHPRFRVEPHSSPYRPGVDRTKLNQLVDELEAQEFIEKPR